MLLAARRHRLTRCLLALALCAGGAGPARAQFYSLEGRYECLNHPAAVCYDATSTAPAVVAPPPPAAPAKVNPAARHAKKAARAPLTTPHAAADPLDAVAKRVQSGLAAPADLALLRARAAAADRRATELLAWCHLKGVGTPKDLVPAYLLYGAAARLGVPNAERNQAIVYETAMTPEQRQQALMIEDRVTSGAR
jgi:TPR repeat protein